MSGNADPSKPYYTTSGPDADFTDLIKRTGGPKIPAITLPPYPCWIDGPDGKRVLVADEAAEAALTEKAPAAKK